MRLRVLDSGSCEVMKGGVHGAALGLVVLMGIYNAAAWLRRRERHLAVNAVLYSAAAVWECHHVGHHWRALGSSQEDHGAGRSLSPSEASRAA